MFLFCFILFYFYFTSQNKSIFWNVPGQQKTRKYKTHIVFTLFTVQKRPHKGAPLKKQGAQTSHVSRCVIPPKRVKP